MAWNIFQIINNITNKSVVKRRNTLSPLDQYTALEVSARSHPQMEVSAPTNAGGCPVI